MVWAADTLGNAYFTSFFVTGAWDRSKLHQSLRAYQNVVSPLFVIFFEDKHSFISLFGSNGLQCNKSKDVLVFCEFGWVMRSSLGAVVLHTQTQQEMIELDWIYWKLSRPPVSPGRY
jgi:hypothetical protein